MESHSSENRVRTLITVCFCTFVLLMSMVNIRLAGGRALMAGNGRETFRSGASASITGNMLTTSGSTIAGDRAMLKELGRDVTPDWERPEEERADYAYRYRGE